MKALGDPERKLFIAAAHAANEITVLQKALVRSMGFPANQDEAKKATSTQNLVLAKLLAGKLNEAWQMLRTCYFSGISRELNPLHPDEAKAAQVIEPKRPGSVPFVGARRQGRAGWQPLGNDGELTRKPSLGQLALDFERNAYWVAAHLALNDAIRGEILKCDIPLVLTKLCRSKG